MRLHPSPAATHAPEPVESDVSVASRGRSLLKRRLLWAAGIAALLLLLVITPPLINANRYRVKIASSMSASLGRPVHLDDVSFHFLPVPGFTLTNLVVSEDPAFGAEPTIRANTVEATLRVSSLWHRPVEFSTVRFVEPSVNLVRNAEGRWNLSEVLLHASRVDSAPTAQRHAGPAPRFPYIEATSGRVNVKLGAEKLPYSLNDTDFALWLPSAQQWRVRLVGHPIRTDTNINDPGTVRLEGELRRAETVSAVPVNFRASWHDAPLGEASRVLTGDDWGWRGSLNVDATLAGTLGDARLASKLTLGGLRRGEFFPARPLDLQITCGSGFQLRPGAMLTNLQCILPDDAPSPLTLIAERIETQQAAEAHVTVQGSEIPARWALLWASLFSARIPTDLQPSGTVAVNLVHGPYVPAAPPPARGRNAGRRRPPVQRAVAGMGTVGWSGHVDVTLPAIDEGTAPGTASGEAGSTELHWQVTPVATGGWPSFTLAPMQVRLGAGALVTVNAALMGTGYSFSVNGMATAAGLLLPARYLPQLQDGVDQVLPYPPTGTTPTKVSFTCTKTWTAPQTCTGLQQGTGVRAPVGVVVGPVPRAATPSLLTPQNLSPLERAPFSTPQPPTAPTTPPQ